jgi:hypothetical protein
VATAATESSALDARVVRIAFKGFLRLGQGDLAARRNSVERAT